MYFDNPKQTAQAEKLLKNYIQKLNNRWHYRYCCGSIVAWEKH
jgi:hypothetical protein